MLKVGITGGIGSGKTTVCKIFEALSIPVYYADDRAKSLMVTNTDLVQQIKKIFGAAAYHSDGSLNRKHLSAIAFQDKSKLALLNAVVHPAVAKDSIIWHQTQSTVPYTLKEAALLVESNSYQQLDKMIAVFAPEEVRIERVMKRDQSKIKDIKARIDQQLPDKEKIKLADYIIFNDKTSQLIPQVLAIHRQLTAIAEASV